MKKAIIVFIVLFAVSVLGNSRPFHFSTDRDATKIRVTVAEGNRMIDDIYGRLDLLGRPQSGIDTTNAPGTDTVTVPITYSDTLYFVQIMPIKRDVQAPAFSVWVISNNQFGIKFYPADTVYYFRWKTTGGE